MIYLFLNNAEVPVYGVPSDIITAFIRIIINSPPLLVLSVTAYISGHLWAYIILTYVSKKERKILCSLLGRISCGVAWFALIAIPVSIVTYCNLLFTIDRIISISITTTIFSLALQSLILILINFFARERNKRKNK